MKCSNCGAEIDSSEKKCPFCDCEVIAAPEPTAQNQTTITNNYYGASTGTSETNTVCPKCSSNKIKFKREEIGSKKGKKEREVLYRTVGICQDCGYTWNPNAAQSTKKHGILWWILMICIWPIALSVWFYKTEKIKLAKKYRLIIIAVVWVLFFVLCAASSSSDAPSATTPADSSVSVTQAADVETTEFVDDAVADNAQKTTATTTKPTTTTTKPTTTTTTKPAVSLGKLNALQSAKLYLSTMAFSYKGLIKQLEYEGYSTEEAAYGADNCGADWNEQAAKSAKNYLDMMSFSKDGLIQQLEFEGFTHEQAVYGAQAVGY